MIPSSKLTCNGKSPFLIDTSSKGPFSIAMLVYRSVKFQLPPFSLNHSVLGGCGASLLRNFAVKGQALTWGRA